MQWGAARLSGLLAVLLVALLWTVNPDFFAFLDNRIYDYRVRGLAPHKSSGLPIIVDIDDESLAKIGQWPWPRYVIADLLTAIAEQKPASAALDILFAEPDRASLSRVLKEAGEHFGVNFPVRDYPQRYRDNDLIAAKALQSGPFVLPFFLTFDEAPDPQGGLPKPVNALFISKSGDAPAPVGKSLPLNAVGAVVNIAPFSEAVTMQGFMNARPDDDGVVRRAPLVVSIGEKIYPSLALAALLKAVGTEQIALVMQDGALSGVRVQDVTIPVDRGGNVSIRYLGEDRRFEHVSALDVMERRVGAARFTDRIVLVGTSAAGLSDLRATPLDPIFPGVEVHATIIDNVVTGEFLHVPSWASVWVLLCILVLGGVVAWFISTAHPVGGLCYLVAGGALVYGGSHWYFFARGGFLAPAAPLVSLGLSYVVQTAVNFRLGEIELSRRTDEVVLTQYATIKSLAALAEYRDPETGGHLERTREYVRLLAQTLSVHPKYSKQLTPSAIDWLTRCAVLHDMGKVAIPDSILLKPARLTDEEYLLMKTHAIVGGNVVAAAAGKLGGEMFLQFAQEVASTHHEKWDGTGYPKGLKGEDIPLPGRLMALADVYDAIISKRVYKPPMPHAHAVKNILADSGTFFDPAIVKAFIECHEQFRAAALEFADNDEERENLKAVEPMEESFLPDAK